MRAAALLLLYVGAVFLVSAVTALSQPWHLQLSTLCYGGEVEQNELRAPLPQTKWFARSLLNIAGIARVNQRSAAPGLQPGGKSRCIGTNLTQRRTNVSLSISKLPRKHHRLTLSTMRFGEGTDFDFYKPANATWARRGRG